MSMGDDENNAIGINNNDWPQTVDEAVDRLLAGLSDKDKETVLWTPKDELYKFHFWLGHSQRFWALAGH